MFGIKVLGKPLLPGRVFLVFRIFEDLQKIFISPRSAAILRRTGSGYFETDGGHSPFCRQDLFHQQLVFPTVSEVVFIEDLVLEGKGEILEGDRVSSMILSESHS